MPKYLFKGLDAASAPGPGPTLWFQSPTSFNDMAAQVKTSSTGFGVAVEITLNGSDFRAATVGFPPNAGNISHPMFSTPLNGGYARLGPVGLMMGLRLNLLNPLDTETQTITVLLAIDQKD